jgi:hypothetical protein
MVPTQRSANAFAFGARNGVRMISTPSLRKTSSKARLNLLSRSWIRNRAGVARSESDQANWRACWVVQRPSGVRGAACEVHAPAAEFEEEEHVEASEPERLDGEEVAGDNRTGVGTQEVAPAELGASARRRDAGSPEDLGDCCRRDSLTYTCEFTDDPLVAPARVLTRESQHELTDLLRDCGASRSRSRVRPPSPYKLAVPTQQRVRLNEKRRPARPAEKPAGRGKENPVGLVQPRTGDLAAKNREFVSEHHDLELLELAGAKTQRRERKRTPKQQVHQRHHHEAVPLRSKPKEPRLYGP